MISLRRQLDSSSRAAFTLVELLVAMTIFLILATLTVAAFRGNDQDRISAATATFKNALEGARSRAIKSGQIRGLRLITDPADGRIATSLVYVGAPDFGEGTVSNLAWYAGEDVNGNGIMDTGEDINGNGILDPSGWYVKSSDLLTLYGRGLLNVGDRIRLSASPFDTSPNWYTIARIEYDENGNSTFDTAEDRNNSGTQDIILAGQFQPSYWTGSTYRCAWFRPTPVTVYYHVQGSSTVLPGAEPILMPRNTCIDLDGSYIPGSWLVYSSGSVSGYGQAMDILFSPRGDLAGTLGAAGIIHFHICQPSDLVLARAAMPGQLPRTTATPYVVADPEHGHKGISIFTQTGAVISAEINSSNPNSTFNDNYVGAATAYYYGIRGKEAK